ncbi:efflux RND transporter periplasmic adaptor subunit [Asticcacaulis endophyticus]|uniref:MexE family multidrug efflux RND transporter periplasmic adaptor subunit n=1 Tax=Asticcacaulis endophyticus TaxID=1395890 RepID=A0A918QCR9_9CAUL|nr:efflux RND transporter periplasmic adaptor subunit [Asticcacaulis endophyticus]GGZ39518.1 MexE family multidrug efflux RND transporter periplasmic adaptor subunit [Asticcacaulis endophyticus]
MRIHLRTLLGQTGRTALIVGAAGVLLVACGNKNAAQGMGAGGPAEVGIVVVQSEPVTLTTELSGRTSAFLVSEVRPQVNGIVKARLFEEGSVVSAGQSLYQIDSATYQAAYNSAAAGLAQANASLTSAKLLAGRYTELVKINAVSQQANDDAQAALQQAEANVAAQKAAVDNARINLGYTKVLAPISGRIGKSSVTSGALVTASQATPLATIQATDKIYVDINQTTSELLSLQKAMADGSLGASSSADVELILEDGSVYPQKGRLEFSDVTVDPETGSVNLRAIFNNPNGTLLPGMYVRARLTKGVVGQGILVPQAAVQRDPKGNASVMVVGKDNKVEPRPVQIAQMMGDKWVVTSGLQSNDRVIVDGLMKVQGDAPVKPVVVGAKESDAPTPAAKAAAAPAKQ